MNWIPVTFLQVSADMAVAVDVPDGHGHRYVKDVLVNAWAAILQPTGWTTEKTETLRGRQPRTTRSSQRRRHRGQYTGLHQPLVATDDIGRPVQTEILQRRRGKARGVALGAQHHPLDIVVGRLRQSGVTGRVAAPLQHVALDHQRTGQLALECPLGRRPDVDQNRAAIHRRRDRGGLQPAQPVPGPGQRSCRSGCSCRLLRLIGQLGAGAPQSLPSRHLVVGHRRQGRRVARTLSV